jgi:PEGA domain-containing protein
MFLAFGQWFPYPYPIFGIPPGPGFFGRDPFSSVRLQVTPREGIVYVDGYAAGMVNDFDGVFQRLHLVPGHHEIVVYLQGYRTFRQNLYFNPGSSHTIRHTMVPLAAGEAPEPPPVPLMPPAQVRGIPLPQSGPPQQTSRSGQLTLRVQPFDASVIVDGEVWRGPQSQDRLVIQLAEGTHQLRVEKAGFQTFAVEVEIKAGETSSFNVSLMAQ